MSAKKFLRKVVSMRKKLLKDGKSQKNLMEVAEALKPLDAWLNAYPNATDQAALKVLKANSMKVLCIMPGKSCSAHDRLMEEFDDLMCNQLTIDI